MFRTTRSRIITTLVGLPLVGGAVALTIQLTKDEPSSPAPVTAQTAPSHQGMGNSPDAELQELLRKYGSGYDCPVNNTAQKISDLKLCPDYVAQVAFDERGKPAIVAPLAMQGVKPITITATYVKSCGNDGVKGRPVTCTDLWRIRWAINPAYVALGENHEMVDAVRTDGSHWSGPNGLNNRKGDRLVSADDTKTIEVYASDPQLHFQAAPLTVDRQALKF